MTDKSIPTLERSPIIERWHTDLTGQSVWSSNGGMKICQTCKSTAYPSEWAQGLARRISRLPDIERERGLLLGVLEEMLADDAMGFRNRLLCENAIALCKRPENTYY